MNMDLQARQQQAIINGLAILAEPDQVIEVRILGVDGRQTRVDAGYFDDVDLLAKAVTRYTYRAVGVYFTLNPVKPPLLARASNRIIHWVAQTTADSDIMQRRWLPIDIDPVRASGISSTGEEHAMSLDRALRIREWLADFGWPEPVLLASGNGSHMLYRIDLANNEEAHTVVQRCLQAISAKHSDNMVHIDPGMGNAGRIWRLPFTRACKGDHTAERPHRWSKIISADNPVVPVSVPQLSHLARLAPHAPEPQRGASTGFDVDVWLATHGILVADSRPWKGGTRWKLADCPLSDQHTDGAYVVQLSNGALSAGCHHNSCTWNWHDLRAQVEGTSPGASNSASIQHIVRNEVTQALSGFKQELLQEIRALPTFP